MVKHESNESPCLAKKDRERCLLAVMDYSLRDIASADNLNILRFLREANQCTVEIVCDDEKVVRELLLFLIVFLSHL